MKRYCFFLYSVFTTVFLYAQISFNPVAITGDNSFLFNSNEIIGGNDPIRTLFSGTFDGSKTSFNSVSFYPEQLYYFPNFNKIFIQNRIGLYQYDLKKQQITPVQLFPSLTGSDEYIISDICRAAVSPNTRYVLGKTPTSPSKATIFLYDLIENSKTELVQNVETLPGQPVALWAPDSNYFIYQKNNRLYYFSLTDYKSNKQLSEEWRFIGDVLLSNTAWTNDGYLIWLEQNIIYKADPNQFYYRSIYKNYLRQGAIIGKIPFVFDNSLDRFVYNYQTDTFVIVREGSSIFYFSLKKNFTDNPYIQLNETMRYDTSTLFPDGEGIVGVDIMRDGKINKILFLLKKNGDSYQFKQFAPEQLAQCRINSFSVHEKNKTFLVNTSKGAFHFDFATEKLLWQYDSQNVLHGINIFGDSWILAGSSTTVFYDKTGKITPLFISSVDSSGFLQNALIAEARGTFYKISKTSNLILEVVQVDMNKLITTTKNNRYRILSREIKKGFYAESVYLKELYTGELITVTGEPRLNYQLYQPEVENSLDFYDNPVARKYEIALLFDCIKTSEGVFPVLKTLDQFKITSSFFINGNFMDINPLITREITYFDIEIGNMFQYYVNLTSNKFLIDQKFIRQGLSVNEEKFFDLTGKNFAPYWHAPMFALNESIVNYGTQAGYAYVSYNLDSFDWVGKNNKELHYNYYMSNSELIDRILTKIKPGQVMLFNIGKNHTERDEWLFNDIDILITELVRSGYSFTSVSSILKRYRK